MKEVDPKLATKLADYESEINILTDLISISRDTEKIKLYKKDLTKLKSLYTRTKNTLEKSLV